MCGIVGYVGPQHATPILLGGLQRVEYRGYDSAGIAVISPSGELLMRKAAGKLKNLQSWVATREQGWHRHRPPLGDAWPPQRRERPPAR
jgi:glucosamine--fructose-6-phosphate aminotransferase (isomerizing)